MQKPEDADKRQQAQQQQKPKPPEPGHLTTPPQYREKTDAVSTDRFGPTIKR